MMWQDECEHEWVDRGAFHGDEAWLWCEHCNALCAPLLAGSKRT